jgi:hypothetical protein
MMNLPIDSKVVKKSKKPFKSGMKVETIVEIIRHPILNEDAYLLSDGSVVAVKICKEYKNDA